MDAATLAFIAYGTAAATGVLGLITVLVKWGKPRAIALADTVREFAILPGIVNELAAQWRPNGGSTPLDKLNLLCTDMRHIKATLRAHGDTSIDGIFKADATGAWTEANVTFLRWTERQERDVVGYGWQSCVSVYDRDEVAAEWADCIAKRREFHMHCVLVSVSGNETPADMLATPMRDGHHVIGWVGHIRKRGLTGQRAALRVIREDNGA